ncbi:LPS export ABC transporter periplasmic protein LptC [Dyadobacter psychrotolerans]|uniref:LPS export ABC transporter periplasmic protein LptC n=1 Tax=Dyadobacter psychrotolerans TaxID=2541721 RepID=A0A4R5DYW5_9BACT|nr:LPS export ABC transporter periplasmic protein LptC [Dyadobacter psychrotolerans]TDE16393.1 LPS export ABC transporter periplasmic protein LptC [Dyadobacter psychrotolerans]
MQSAAQPLKLPRIYGCIVILLLFTIILPSCEKDRNKIGAAYEGPIEIVNDVEIKYSEQGVQKVQMLTRESLTYSNQNKIFPDTININFFDPITGTIETRLRADSGRYDQATNVYIVKGHVRVVKPDQILTTTELSWNPGTKKVFTDKPLTIKNLGKSEFIKAVGMDAEQDFTRIKLRQGKGIISGAP